MRHVLPLFAFIPLFVLHGAEPAATEPPAKPASLVLHGQLLDENGQAPLANQDVYSDSVGTKVTTTDAGGFFDYPVKDGQEAIHVLPWSREVVGRSVFISVADFKDKVFRIVVERGVALRVKVVDRDAKPIADVPVAWVGSGGASGRSGKDGIALVGRISRFKNGSLVARVPDCQPVEKKDICAASYVDQDVVLVVPDYVPPPEEDKKTLEKSKF